METRTMRKFLMVLLPMVFVWMLSTVMFVDRMSVGVDAKPSRTTTTTATESTTIDYDSTGGVLKITGSGNLSSIAFTAEQKKATSIVIEGDGKGSGISINSSIFSGFYNLKSVTISGNVSSISVSCFSSCSSLESVDISVNSGICINASTFSDCSNLKSVTLSGNVTGINSGAFSGCTSLTSITIPESVTSIASGAFSGCKSLESVTITSGSTNIDKDAFSNCEKLTSVVILESVDNFDLSAFSNLKASNTIRYYDDVTTSESGEDDTENNVEDAESSDEVTSDTDKKSEMLPENTGKNIAVVKDESISIAECDGNEKESEDAVDGDENNKDTSNEVDAEVDTNTDTDTYTYTFDVKISADRFGGDDAAYLDSVYLLIDNKEYKITKCYEEKGYVVFPVEITTSLSSVTVRGEVYARPTGDSGGDVIYYASSESKYTADTES